MVTKTEETQLNQLENQVDNGGGGAWEYLCLVRKLKARRSEKVLKHGSPILKRSDLGSDEWTLNEQVAIAAMDCQCLDVAQNCIKVLRKKFPESKRVGRLEALLLEAKGLWGEAEEAYSSLLEDNPLDQAIHKRRVAITKALGRPSLAFELLNKYLELFMADHDAWRELAEVYLSLQMYKQAAFCYEELILSQPTVPLYHLAYADITNQILYTIGGVENLISARKYYAATVELTGGKNTRALFGICLCASAIAHNSKGRNKEDKEAMAAPELHSLAAAALVKEYKEKAPAKLQLISSALRSLKLRSLAKHCFFNVMVLLYIHKLSYSCLYLYLFSLSIHVMRDSVLGIHLDTIDQLFTQKWTNQYLKSSTKFAYCFSRSAKGRFHACGLQMLECPFECAQHTMEDGKSL